MMDWVSIDPNISEIYSKLSIVGVLVPAIFTYFSYAFPDENNVSLKKVLLIFIPILPFIFLAPTKFNIEYIDSSTPDCDAVLGSLYYLIPVVFVTYVLWSFIVLFKKFKKGTDQIKKQIKLVLIGFSSLIAWALVTNVTAPLIGLDKLSFFGPIGAIVFVFFVAYSITKYKFLNIKVLLVQALVVWLVILIGSQFFFIRSFVNQLLTGFTLILLVIFGWVLINSVKKEVQQKEELEVANKKIDRKNVKLSIANKEISKRKEALEVANKEISKRGGELQRMADSLAIANDKLRQLDNAKTEFIGLVNHQLLHAPTPIKDYLAMLLEGSYGEIPENQIKVLKNINAANDRQIHLTEDLMAVTRMESGKIELTFTKEKLEDICQGVYVNVEPTAKEKNLVLEYEKPKTALPELVLDKSKIFEAIFNFVDNAVKYTPAGKIVLKVELDSSSRYKPQSLEDQDKKAIAGQVVRVTVADTGSGISKENISQLFAKFSRKDVAKLNANGTGLGLYLVKLTIEAHGGRTWAESEGEGKGAQFIIELPVKTPEEILAQVQNTIKK
jgi:signal transduction histidine kinase